MPAHWSIPLASAAGLDPMHRNPPESKEPLCRGSLPGTLARTSEVSQGAATSTFVHWHHLLIHRMAKHNSDAASLDYRQHPTARGKCHSLGTDN